MSEPTNDSTLPAEATPAATPAAAPTHDHITAPVAPTTPAAAGPIGVQQPEYVLGGLAYAAVAVVGGVILAGIIWKLGFIGAIASLVMAGGGVALYAKGAGTPPRKGRPALIVLILLGIVVAFFVCVGIDLSDYYSANAPADTDITRMHFITQNLFTGETLSLYGKDIAMFAIFGLLGAFSVVRRLIADRKA